MSNKKIIEDYFLNLKGKGLSSTRALDKTVSHFFHIYNPFYVRSHIRTGPLWTN